MDRFDRMTTLPQPELDFVRRSIRLATEARERGDHPFGALLVGADGEVLAEATNTVGTTGDRTGHAERNLMSDVSRRFEPELLAASTMYTSTEPCAMCAASNVPSLDLPCRDVFTTGSRPTEVVGPVLAAEAAVPHEGFWSAG